MRFDDRGWVKVVDRGRQGDDADRRAVRRAGSGVDARRVDASCSRATPSARRCCSRCRCRPSGGAPPRPVFGVPAGSSCSTSRGDGRWLAVREDLSVGVRASVPEQDAERDLSWLGSVGARALSADGQWLLMVDVGQRGGRNYGVVLRKTDASQTIRLGEGFAAAAVARRQVGRRDHRLAGAAPALPHRARASGPDRRRPDRRAHLGGWFPDGKRLLVCGSEASRAPRCYARRPRRLGAGAAHARGRPGHAGAGRPDAAARDGRRRVPAVLDRRRPGAAGRRACGPAIGRSRGAATAARSTSSAASRCPPASSASCSRPARARSCGS